ncbi:MAG: chloride channel protein [Verrucomicrobiales bacterium]|nr:chloride channel protein [Verrucomicrobiales bacterium]
MNEPEAPQRPKWTLPPGYRQALRIVAFATVASLSAVAFHYAIHYVFDFGLKRFARIAPEDFYWISFIVCIGGALVAGVLMHYVSRDAAGSGIPQLKANYWKNFGVMTWRQLWVKFVAGAVQIGTGSSLGREGPSVQIAAAAGSLLSGAFGDVRQRRRAGAVTGAAAGLAAAFNTPLAAVTFVLEEIIGDLNSRLMGRVLLAAVVGALVTHGFIGADPAFTLSHIGNPTMVSYLLVPVVSAAAGLVGVAFQAGSLSLRARSRKWKRIPGWLRPSIGALVVWALGATVFAETGHLGVFGLGYEDMTQGLAGQVTWNIALLLVLTKLVGTIACYGTGGAGGIFTPTLFMGAMTGIAFGAGLDPFLGLSRDGVVLLAIVGMTGTLGAVVRAPVTSILIVFEMTHEFAVVPPLMLGALISQWVSRLLPHNFYDALLIQDGHDVERFSPPLDIRRWRRQPTSVLANPNPILCENLAPEALIHLRRNFPYTRFPVVENGMLLGILTRDEMRTAAAEDRPVQLEKAVTCLPDTSLQAIEAQLIESHTGMVVVLTPAGSVKGLFTLNDLLRAQHQLAGMPD